MVKESYKYGVLIFVLHIFSVQGVFAQANSINEEDVPMKIQMYLYSNYNHAENVAWSEVENIGDQLFEARFSHNSFAKRVIFKADGTLQSEVVESNGGVKNLVLAQKVMERHPKSKVTKVRRITMYKLAGQSKPSFYYEVEARSKGEKFSVYFDEQREFMTNDNIFNLAVN